MPPGKFQYLRGVILPYSLVHKVSIKRAKAGNYFGGRAGIYPVISALFKVAAKFRRAGFRGVQFRRFKVVQKKAYLLFVGLGRQGSPPLNRDKPGRIPVQ
jgi:hypothetical protein